MSVRRALDRWPRRVVERGVRRKIPNNGMRNYRMQRLFVFDGNTHPFDFLPQITIKSPPNDYDQLFNGIDNSVKALKWDVEKKQNNSVDDEDKMELL